MSDSNPAEGTTENDEEIYYNKLYEREQYRKAKSSKCAKKLEQILELKINRVKSAKIKLPWNSYLSNRTQKLQSELQTNAAFSDCETFFSGIYHDGKPFELMDNNLDLKVQRLLRQVEEIQQVEGQIQSQKHNEVYKILNKV
ncbi:uncharacterized protein LOC135938789 [Cloeon dipterum]|uniref:uncharacterized protein LOC135938789 n=1 Tax=Cloeon dipterum TaxID=197152 RepID=UPI00321F822D